MPLKNYKPDGPLSATSGSSAGCPERAPAGQSAPPLLLLGHRDARCRRRDSKVETVQERSMLAIFWLAWGMVMALFSHSYWCTGNRIASRVMLGFSCAAGVAAMIAA